MTTLILAGGVGIKAAIMLPLLALGLLFAVGAAQPTGHGGSESGESTYKSLTYHDWLSPWDSYYYYPYYTYYYYPRYYYYPYYYYPYSYYYSYYWYPRYYRYWYWYW